jgi:hypothetical protein
MPAAAWIAPSTGVDEGAKEKNSKKFENFQRRSRKKKRRDNNKKARSALTATTTEQ